MSTRVSNLTKNTLSIGAVNLGPDASVNVDVLTSEIMSFFASGLITLSPLPATRTLSAIVDNTGGTPAAGASFSGTIAATTLTVDQGVSVMAALVVNAAFNADLVNVPVTFTGGTVPTGGAQATGLMSTGAGGTTATITILTKGNYTAAPTGVTGTGLGAGSWTTFTPTLTENGLVGTIVIGQTISGTGVTAGTYITAGSGVSWTVSASQTVSTLREITAVAGLAAIAAGGTYSQADLVAAKNAIASLTVQLNAAKIAIDYLTVSVAKLASEPDARVLTN